MNRQVNDACQDGFDACQDGKPISCNPFNTLQPEYAEWNNGWRAADFRYEPPGAASAAASRNSPRYRADMVDAGRGRLLR